MTDQFLDSILSDPSYDLQAMDCEGFQDLKLWCDLPTMDEQLNTPSIDKEKRFAIGQILDTNTPFNSEMNPSGVWDTFNIGDDAACTSPDDLLSSVPCIRDDLKEDPYNVTDQFNVDALDIENMPIVFKDLPNHEESVDIISDGQVFMGARGLDDGPSNDEGHIIIKEEEWDMPIGREENVDETSNDNLQTCIYSTFSQFSTHNTSIPHYSHSTQEVGGKTMNSFENYQLPNDNKDIRDVFNSQKVKETQFHYAKPPPKRNVKNLNLTIAGPARYSLSEFKNLNPVVTTPDVLLTVEQLETDRKFNLLQYIDQVPPPSEETILNYDGNIESRLTDISKDEVNYDQEIVNQSHEELYVDITPPVTPQFQSTKKASKRRRASEDSDESYVPPTRKRSHKTRKPSVGKGAIAIKLQLELAPHKKKGRPPKRRESLASTCTNTTDDNVSTLSTEEQRYRELRDKNNEASRRSRMNRKLKEHENEDLAQELEKRNRMLTVKAERLEKTAKLLKDALMAAMLKR